MSLLFLENLFLVFVRALSLCMSAPVISSRSVPQQAKIGLAFLVAFALVHDDSTLSPLSSDMLPFATAIAQEVLVGLLLGFAAQLIFAVMEIAATMMGAQAGFGAANTVLHIADFSGNPLSQLYFIVASLIFLAIDGHHQLLLGLDATLKALPVGTLALTPELQGRVLDLLQSSWIAAMRISLPVMAVLLITDVALALLSRAVPQMNVFFVGAPLKIGVGMLMIVASLPAVLPLFRTLIMNIAQQNVWLLGTAH